MSSDYKAILPQVQKTAYLGGSYADFILTFEDLALHPDCVHIAGEFVAKTAAGGNVGPNDTVYFNPRVGSHGFFGDVTTDMNAIGVAEQLDDYPSYVSLVFNGIEFPLERGTTTRSARELRVPTYENARALCQSATTNSPVSFCTRLRSAINKFNQHLNYSTSNEVRIRIRLAENDRVLFDPSGTQPTYELRNLKLLYKTMQPAPYVGELTTEVINSDLKSLDSTKETISMLIPTGTTDSLLARCIKVSHDQNAGYDKLALEPVPSLVPGTQNLVSDKYGFNRIIYSVNDVDSAPVNFNLESREAIITNYLRALRKDWKFKNSYQLVDLNNGGIPESYAIGINFGGLIDFSKQSFSMNLESEIESSDPYHIYLHSRSLIKVA
jgi:hypothetical protein